VQISDTAAVVINMTIIVAVACSSNAQHFALALDSSQAKAYDPAR